MQQYFRVSKYAYQVNEAFCVNPVTLVTSYGGETSFFIVPPVVSPADSSSKFLKKAKGA